MFLPVILKWEGIVMVEGFWENKNIWSWKFLLIKFAMKGKE